MADGPFRRGCSIFSSSRAHQPTNPSSERDKTEREVNAGLGPTPDGPGLARLKQLLTALLEVLVKDSDESAGQAE